MMIPLILAVGIASLLGSLHCVGMCGPLAAVCFHTDSNRKSAFHTIAAYHLGRLASYALLGSIAGWLGSSLQDTSTLLGIQKSVASIAGVIMATIGLIGLMRVAAGKTLNFHPPQLVVRLAAPAVRWLRQRSTWHRALGLGLLTAALPCGWLYVFLLTAAATASPLSGAVVMAVFSFGSVPLLSLAMLGSDWFGRRFRYLWPALSAGLLIVVGSVTALHRSQINLTPLHATNVRSHAEMRDTSNITTVIDKLTNAPLPCCQAADLELVDGDSL